MESEGDQSHETEAAPSSGPIWKAGLGGGNLSFEVIDRTALNAALLSELCATVCCRPVLILFVFRQLPAANTSPSADSGHGLCHPSLRHSVSALHQCSPRRA